MFSKAGVRCFCRGALAALLALLSVLPAGAGEAPRTHLLVKLRPEAWQVQRVLAGYPIAGWAVLDVPGWVRVDVAADRMAYVLAQVARDPNVLAVEQDRRVQAAMEPNDTYWSRQWGPLKIGAPAAWDKMVGRSDIVIAILDTGADVDHADLAGQLWVNPGEVPGNSLDDDGNGQVDDIHGWQFTHDADENPYQSDNIDDDHGHGTHVTGIAVAQGNNERGIAGLAWGCRAMIVKVLDENGDGWYSDVADGVVYAVDNGARIVNLSLGGADESSVMEDAVQYAQARGALVVAAAGNSGSAVLYPAAYDGALAVAASDANDRWATYSCSGPEVELAAPGSSIYSTCIGDRYCYKSGTSMATPHVSGLAALIWSGYYTYTAAQVRQRMIDTAQDIESPGWDPYSGWGRIDAREALSAVVPSAIYIPLILLQGSSSWPWTLATQPG
jgi:thermitase